MKNMKKRSILFTIIILQLIIYLTFLYIDFKNTGANNHMSITLKYSGILLCFLTALLTDGDGHSKRDTLLLQLGLFFTTLADFNLLILNQFIIGVTLFCVVQTIYILRYNPRLKMNFIFISLVTILIVLILGLCIDSKTPGSRISLYLIAILYGILLILSVINALLTCKRKVLPGYSCCLVSIGMILFLLCDINVGLYNILSIYNGKTVFVYYLTSLSGNLIWLFYFPSQVLISLSGYKINSNTSCQSN
jgi:hypothetical protein